MYLFEYPERVIVSSLIEFVEGCFAYVDFTVVNEVLPRVLGVVRPRVRRQKPDQPQNAAVYPQHLLHFSSYLLLHVTKSRIINIHRLLWALVLSLWAFSHRLFCPVKLIQSMITNRLYQTASIKLLNRPIDYTEHNRHLLCLINDNSKLIKFMVSKRLN